MTGESVLTRRFSRPRDYSQEAMKAELAGLPARWRIYGIDSFVSGRRYHVEFRVGSGQLDALKTACDRLDSMPA